MRALTRAWQILFKGYDEVGKAGNALQAAEMVLVRLAYAADLPTPDELATKFSGEPSRPGACRHRSRPARQRRWRRSAAGPAPVPSVPRPPDSKPPAPSPQPGPVAMASPQSYAELVALAGEKRDLIVKHALEASLRPIAFADGRIEVALAEGADPGIIQTLSARLKLWTGRSWMVSVGTTTELVPTVREIETQRQEARKAAAHEDPLVRAILETFPGARVSNVTVREQSAPAMPEPPPVSADDEEDDDE
jgi:DNA polymerase III subunit gamma/tau